MHWFAFSVVLGCLFVSAFFAASETALTGASRASMLRLSKQGNRQAIIVSKLLDMRELRHALHPCSRAALEEVKRRRSKAIVLVNRRGWAPFLVCRSCGNSWSCPRSQQR